jgi:serine phosphatase RsbU (regulator of sigma subunit)
MVRRVLDDGASLLTTDAQADSRFRESASVISQGIRAAMAAPLYDNHHIIGLLYADTTDAATRYGPDELRAFTVLANLIAVKLTQARLAAMEAEKRRLEGELATAREIIGNIVPDGVPAAEGYEFMALYEPCSEVGGDLYDVRHMPDGRTVLMAGDVAGKGLGAAILMSSIVPLAHVLIGGERELVGAMDLLNRQMCASTDAVRYATLFVGLLDRASGRLEYVNAGHNPPLLVDAAGNVQEIHATAMPVGMLEEAPFASASIDMTPGSVLVVFSDGITEALGSDGSFYEVERLRRVVRDARAFPLDVLIAKLVDDLRSFTQGTPQSDDITLLAVRRSPGPQDSGPSGTD